MIIDSYLNETAELVKASVRRTLNGAPVFDYDNRETIRIQIREKKTESAGSAEQGTGNQITTKEDASARVRPETNVSTEDLIIYGGHTYKILSIDFVKDPICHAVVEFLKLSLGEIE